MNLKENIDNLPLGSVIMLENTRFEDVPSKFESSNNSELAQYWASLGDIFCLDAFGSAHRSQPGRDVLKGRGSPVRLIRQEGLN